MELTPKTKKILIIVGIILTISIISYFVFKKPKQDGIVENPDKKIEEDKEVDNTTLNSKEPLPDTLDFTNCPKDDFPLKIGSCGARVEQAQKWLLREKGAKFEKYGIDGKWGYEMQDIVYRLIQHDSISEDYFFRVKMNEKSITITNY